MNINLFAKISPATAGVFVCALFVLLGCATPQIKQLQETWPANLPTQAHIQTMPFFAQEEYECGPAALAMVFQKAGVSVLPEQLVEQVYLPGKKGSLQVEMQVATRRQGLVSHVLQANIETVLREVAAGNPVVVFQNLSLPIYPVWHYAVVVGFDQKRNIIVLNTGVTERMEMSLTTFERTWERGQYWAMLAMPATQLPATAQAESYAQSIIALERNHIKAAHTAYETALEKWPENRTLLLGLGNTAYGLKQIQKAQIAYEKTTQLHPDYADAWNNLAQTQFELRQWQPALASINKAIAIGGMRLAKYQILKIKIEKSLAQ